MKKILSVFVLLFISLLLFSCGTIDSIKCAGKEKLKIYNWGEYIDEDIIESFEEETNSCVSYVTFSSNEMAMTMMEDESYDVVVPSDYAIEQLVKEDKLQELDWNKILVNGEEFDTNNFSKPLLQMLEQLKNDENNPYDYLSHAVPYFFGSVGIVYNSSIAGIEDDLNDLQWDIFKETSKYDVAYYDSSRDGFIPAFVENNLSINPTSTGDIDTAKSWFIGLNDVPYLTDELLDDMPNKKYDLAMMYSGDAVYVMMEDLDQELKFFKPEKSNIWIDGLVIPKNAKNTELAYKFISYLLNEEIAKQNTLYVGYSSVIDSVYNEMLENDYKDYKSAYEVKVTSNDEIFRYLSSEIKTYIDKEWTNIKTNK